MPTIGSENIIKVPLRADPDGTLRVGNTGVSLLSVLTGFQNGETPEQIVYSFPSLNLPDVYAVISYYLNRREELDGWLAEERRKDQLLRNEAELLFPQEGIRERLLKRKARDQGST